MPSALELAELAGELREEQERVVWQPPSSAIARVEYNRRDRSCAVTFNHGGSYILPNFPEIEFERWQRAGSPGGYWNAAVKGRY